MYLNDKDDLGAFLSTLNNSDRALRSSPKPVKSRLLWDRISILALILTFWSLVGTWSMRLFRV